MTEEVKAHFDSITDRINQILQEHGCDGRSIPPSLLTVVFVTGDIGPLKDYLDYGYAAHPVLPYRGWIAPSDVVIETDWESVSFPKKQE